LEEVREYSFVYGIDSVLFISLLRELRVVLSEIYCILLYLMWYILWTCLVIGYIHQQVHIITLM